MKHCGTMQLETQRLLLRRFTEQDIPAMFKNWASHPAVTRCLTWVSHRSEKETRAVVEGWLRQYQYRDFYEWAIVEKATGQLIGSIGLVDGGSRKCCEAGYCLGEQWWNLGYATEALRAVLDFAVKKVGYRRVIAKHAVENPASGRVMQKAGMSMRIGETLEIPTSNGQFQCLVYEFSAPGRHFFR